MEEWIRKVFDIVGLGGLIVGFTWLGKEIISGFIKDKFMRKQANLEHDYYRKRLQYETKNEMYKKIYFNLKMIQGSFFTFHSKKFDYYFTEIQEEALSRYESILDRSKKEKEETISLYKKSAQHRYKLNYDLSMQTIIDSLKEHNNYLSEIEYLLEGDEKKILKKIATYSKEIEKYVKEARKHFFIEDNTKSYIRFKNEFQDEYTKMCTQLDEYIEDFEKVIKRNLFL